MDDSPQHCGTCLGLCQPWPGWPSPTPYGPGKAPTPVSDAADGDLFSTAEQESREGNTVPQGGEQVARPGKAQ